MYRQYASVEEWVITSTGDRGQAVGTWQTLYSLIPMSIDSLSGRTLELAKQLVASATHKIGLRYQSGIAPVSTRINFGGRIFAIGYVDTFDERNKYLSLIVTEQEGGLP